jgi:hypothetical protein
MQNITIQQVKDSGWLLFEAIAGSKAYGLSTPASDTDIRGVFVLPRSLYYSISYVLQVANATNDIVYYELGRFFELLILNNPNIIELLNIPEHCILYRHPLFLRIQPAMFLSKRCENTFASYAYNQIRKATGLEKKINQPMAADRKDVLAFCYVYTEGTAIPVTSYLHSRGWKQESAGLSAIPNMKDCFNLYYSEEGLYTGIVQKEHANEVSFSSVAREAKPQAILYFNRDGYAAHCRQHKAYWDWVDKRNQARYDTNRAHGRNYDSKNMMHVFRLLLMAREIAMEGVVKVHREDRTFLLDVKSGKYTYTDLLSQAEALKNQLPGLYAQSALMAEPDTAAATGLLVELRKHLYDPGNTSFQV